MPLPALAPPLLAPLRRPLRRWTVPEFYELLARLGIQNGLHRFFDGLPTPLSSGLGLAHQDFVGHLRDALILAQGTLLLAQNFTWGEYLTRSIFSGLNGTRWSSFFTVLRPARVLGNSLELGIRQADVRERNIGIKIW